MAEKETTRGGNGSDSRFARNASSGLAKIQTQKKPTDNWEVCHDDSTPTVKAQTIHELHSLQKKRSTPNTPIRASATQGPFAINISEEERQKQQLQSISASLASLTRETGPKVVKGDPATKAGESRHVDHHHHHIPTVFDATSDSALKFTHILYNLSPAGKYYMNINFN